MMDVTIAVSILSVVIALGISTLSYNLSKIVEQLIEANHLTREIRDKQNNAQSVPYSPSEDLTHFNKPKPRTMRD